MANICEIKGEDSIKDVARFLHNSGTIYFADAADRMHRLIILDPRYLALFVANFLKNGRESAKDGVVRARNLKSYIKAPMFPDSLHAFLLTLLERNDLAFRYNLTNYAPNSSQNSPTTPSSDNFSPLSTCTESADSSSGQTPVPTPTQPRQAIMTTPTGSLWSKAKAQLAVNVSTPTLLSVAQQLLISQSLPENWALWVPLMLPAETPAELEKKWPDKVPPNKGLQFGRRYHVPLSPEVFFWRVIVRLMHFCPRDLFWRHGMLIEPTSLDQGEQILLTFKPDIKAVDVWVRATEKLTGLYRHVFETLETIKRTTSRQNITTTVPCMHCVNKNIEPVYYIPMEECEKAAMKGMSLMSLCGQLKLTPRLLVEIDSVVYCNETRPIKVEYVCPDLSMHLTQGPTRINFNELELTKKIGEGAAAEVFQGPFSLLYFFSQS